MPARVRTCVRMGARGDLGSTRETVRRCEVHGGDVALDALSVGWTPIHYRGGPLVWACPECCRKLGVHGQTLGPPRSRTVRQPPRPD